MMLAEPHKTIAVRTLAAELGRAPSSVSVALSALRRANLVDNEGTAHLPDLFWELASVWKPKYVDVNAVPVPRTGTAILESLRVNIDDVAETGWALSDARAAAAYGAPIAIRADHPPDFYVPDERVMRRAVHLLGTPTGRSERGATLRVAPIKVACARRVDPAMHDWNHTSEHWPLTHPLFVALDLAQDPGRGRHVLNDWTPPEPWPRVW